MTFFHPISKPAADRRGTSPQNPTIQYLFTELQQYLPSISSQLMGILSSILAKVTHYRTRRTGKRDKKGTEAVKTSIPSTIGIECGSGSGSATGDQSRSLGQAEQGKADSTSQGNTRVQGRLEVRGKEEVKLKAGESSTSTPTTPSHNQTQNSQPQSKSESQPQFATPEDNMATDEEYMAFLDKANQDPNEGVATSDAKVEFKTTDADVEIPKVLREAIKDKWYTSDADEEFVVVALRVEGGGLPDESTFAKLIYHPSPADATVEILDPSTWDPQGEYQDVVQAVREVTKGGDVRVYRVEKEGSRVEYWVVGVEGGALLGAKVLAVES
ncbi:hypothetical protein HYALB_00003740 [Hymenoscyphus albidus]|uniref:Uncharacterized protein n=1 Tax=Hymenoscyphus albidus TaxID=595503 RepID=A0A9N9LYK6_9HELO|nr:hypothetical protein HYALB_00003740 [Hymenoscyphus albidus]